MTAGEDGSLAHGTVIDTAITARLARVPLLRLEGTVVLQPAQVAAPEVVASAPPAGPTPVVSPVARNGTGSLIGSELPGLAERLERLRRA